MDLNTKIKFSRNGIEIGEYKLLHVEYQLKLGVIKSTDHYWHEGMTQWEPITKLLSKIEQPRKEQQSSNAKRDNEISKVKREERVDSIFLFLNEATKVIVTISVFIFTVFLFLGGLFVFLDGIFSSPDGSAIRQGVLELKAVRGLLMMIFGTLIYNYSSFNKKK